MKIKKEGFTKLEMCELRQKAGKERERDKEKYFNVKI